MKDKVTRKYRLLTGHCSSALSQNTRSFLCRTGRVWEAWQCLPYRIAWICIWLKN